MSWWRGQGGQAVTRSDALRKIQPLCDFPAEPGQLDCAFPADPELHSLLHLPFKKYVQGSLDKLGKGLVTYTTGCSSEVMRSSLPFQSLESSGKGGSYSNNHLNIDIITHVGESRRTKFGVSRESLTEG